MDRVRVCVRNALDGSELLPATDFQCERLVPQLLTALGSRPSRPIRLFHSLAVLDAGFEATPGSALELTAVRQQALSAKQRRRFLSHIHDCRLDVGAGPVQLIQVFQSFPDAVKDDDTVVLAAIGRNSRCLAHASELLKNDPHFVREAMQKYPACMPYMGERLRGDKVFMLECLDFHHSIFQYISPALKDDVDVVLKAVQLKPSYLAYASDACKDNPLIVQMAVGLDPEAIQFAGSTCQLAAYLGANVDSWSSWTHAVPSHVALVPLQPLFAATSCDGFGTI